MKKIINIQEKIVPVSTTQNGKPGFIYKDTETGKTVGGFVEVSKLTPDQTKEISKYTKPGGSQGYKLDPSALKPAPAAPAAQPPRRQPAPAAAKPEDRKPGESTTDYHKRLRGLLPPAAPAAAPPSPNLDAPGASAPGSRTAPPAAPSAPGRRPAPAPQASPVAAYMKAAAAARKSGDPAEMAKVRDMGLEIWRKSNPKLAAAADERARTRGTSATTNPLMTDMKDRLPAPKPTQSETDASTRSRQTAQAMGMSATARNLAGPAAVPAAVPNLATTAPAAAPAQKPGEFSTKAIPTTLVGKTLNYPQRMDTSGVKLYSIKSTDNVKYTGKEKPVELKKPVPLNQSYQYEPYDLVLEYLLSEGHADTVDEAHYVMMQMSAKHIQNIIEDVYNGPLPNLPKQEKPKSSERGERRVPFAPGSSFGPGYERNNKPKVPPKTPPTNPGRGEGGTGLPPGVLPPNVERYTKG